MFTNGIIIIIIVVVIIIIIIIIVIVITIILTIGCLFTYEGRKKNMLKSAIVIFGRFLVERK